jgi:hypothetical protein
MGPSRPTLSTQHNNRKEEAIGERNLLDMWFLFVIKGIVYGVAILSQDNRNTFTLKRRK